MAEKFTPPAPGFKSRLLTFLTSRTNFWIAVMVFLGLSFVPNLPLVGLILAAVALVPTLYLAARSSHNVYDHWDNRTPRTGQRDSEGMAHYYRGLLVGLALVSTALALRNIAVILDATGILNSFYLMPAPSWMLSIGAALLVAMIVWHHNSQTPAKSDRFMAQVQLTEQQAIPSSQIVRADTQARPPSPEPETEYTNVAESATAKRAIL